MESEPTKESAEAQDSLPLIEPGHTFASITDKISAIVLTSRTPRFWYIGFGLSFILVLVLLYCIAALLTIGVGLFGIMVPVAWGFAIVNFVWWIGIGHAGTLISAILLLLRQKWRQSINRFAEAMTLFAVACAGMFPLLHLGRPGYAYWLFPYPSTMGIQPQFRSPLVWDVFAVSTYFTVSLLFWYMGLIPDLATMRDQARSKLRQIGYGIAALGWTGSNRQWWNYEKAYLLLAGLSTPLVLSVHSIVSFDFAVSQLPGWHTTIFPPYFVAGAIFSGFGMVLTLVLPLRAVCKLQDVITVRHVELMCKVLLATGSIVGYAYGMEFFIAWYSGNPYELYAFQNRAFGPYWWSYWTMITCNVISPHFFWSKRLRTNLWFVFVISIVVNVGMWFERFVIIVTSLHRDYMPSNWAYFSPTWVDACQFIGTIGLFLTLFLLFMR